VTSTLRPAAKAVAYARRQNNREIKPLTLCSRIGSFWRIPNNMYIILWNDRSLKTALLGVGIVKYGEYRKSAYDTRIPLYG